MKQKLKGDGKRLRPGTKRHAHHRVISHLDRSPGLTLTHAEQILVKQGVIAKASMGAAKKNWTTLAAGIPAAG